MFNIGTEIRCSPSTTTTTCRATQRHDIQLDENETRPGWPAACHVSRVFPLDLRGPTTVGRDEDNEGDVRSGPKEGPFQDSDREGKGLRGGVRKGIPKQRQSYAVGGPTVVTEIPREIARS